MKVLGNTIYFNSAPYYYKKGKTGKKPNTIRSLSEGPRYPCMTGVTCITITNSDTLESFTRELTDISFHAGFHIYSWTHK
jgi:hypothetical protein